MADTFGLICRTVSAADATALIVTCQAGMEIVAWLESGRVLLAEHPTEGLVGYVYFREQGQDGHLEWVYVPKFYRRVGFGRALMTALAGDGQRRGWRSVRASVPHNAAANLFFQALNWQSSGDTSRGVGQWQFNLTEDIHG